MDANKDSVTMRVDTRQLDAAVAELDRRRSASQRRAECGSPVRPAPEVRGDSADTMVEHVSGCTAEDALR